MDADSTCLRVHFGVLPDSAGATKASRPPRRDRATARGFTLVEMLLALLIFALMAAAGVSVMVHTADNQNVVQARMARLAEFQRAHAVLKTDLSQAALRRVRHADGTAARRAFVGGRVGGRGPLLAFVRRGWANPERQPRASLQYVEYRLLDGKLQRSSRAALDGVAATTPQVLLTGIESADIAYRFRDEWIDGWPGGATAMPAAIRLTLQIHGIGRIEQVFLLPGVAP